MHISLRIVPALIGLILFVPATSFAHSSVSPSHTLVSKYENFSLSVPTEKEVPTVGVRLIIPTGLERVTPMVKAGWRISTKKDVAGNVTEITWVGGSIPAGQKDVFQFTARTPASSTALVWKAYQTYRGGEIVAWDRDPHAVADDSETVENPWSETTVAVESAPVEQPQSSSTIPLVLSFAAFALSVMAISSTRRKHS